MTAAGEQSVPERIFPILWGFAPPMILASAVQHGIFDALESGPLTAEELAAQLHVSVRGIRALLNALVGLQFLAKEDSRYRLPAESAPYLVRGRPRYLGGMIEHMGDLISGWLQLPEIVKTGKPGAPRNQEEQGAEFFERLVSGLFALNYPAAQALAKTLAVEKTEKPIRVLDLAAGSGVWAIALAQQSPKVTATAVDWPRVIDVTRRFAERFGVADRFSYIPGDLGVVDFGTGYDIATLGQILHSEGVARSRSLLKKTFQALAPGGTIAIPEMLVNADRTGPPMGVIFAVNMLVHTEEGDTFSFEEISGWLGEAGFGDIRRLDPGGPASIILARKAGYAPSLV